MFVSGWVFIYLWFFLFPFSFFFLPLFFFWCAINVNFHAYKYVHQRIYMHTKMYIYVLQAVQKAEEHLLVTQEQSVYREALDESRRQAQAHFLLGGKFAPPPPHGMIPPASNNILAHYSFDFAQQVHQPNNPLRLAQSIF